MKRNKSVPSSLLLLLFLPQQTSGAEFVVVGDLIRCGLTTTETCLKAVTLALSAGSTVSNIYTF